MMICIIDFSFKIHSRIKQIPGNIIIASMAAYCYMIIYNMIQFINKFICLLLLLCFICFVVLCYIVFDDLGSTYFFSYQLHFIGWRFSFLYTVFLHLSKKKGIKLENMDNNVHFFLLLCLCERKAVCSIFFPKGRMNIIILNKANKQDIWPI